MTVLAQCSMDQSMLRKVIFSETSKHIRRLSGNIKLGLGADPVWDPPGLARLDPCLRGNLIAEPNPAGEQRRRCAGPTSQALACYSPDFPLKSPQACPPSDLTNNGHSVLHLLYSQRSQETPSIDITLSSENTTYAIFGTWPCYTLSVMFLTPSCGGIVWKVHESQITLSSENRTSAIFET